MSILVHPETVRQEADATYTDRKGVARSYKRHTVEVTIHGDRRRVACSPDATAITVFGIALRFRTGTKVWPGSAVFWRGGGHVNNIRPNIDKFNGQWCSVVGFFEDHKDSEHRSQHNAVA